MLYAGDDVHLVTRQLPSGLVGACVVDPSGFSFEPGRTTVREDRVLIQGVVFGAPRSSDLRSQVLAKSLGSVWETTQEMLGGGTVGKA